MTAAERLVLLARYRSGPDAVEAKIGAVDGCGADAWDFVPDVADAWSCRAQIAHLLDAEFHGWIRLRKAVAESGAAIETWDMPAWNAALDYADADPRACLALIRAIRGRLAALLEAIADRDWDELHVMHPVHGRMGLAKMLDVYVGHVEYHLGLVDRNLTAYRAAPGAAARSAGIGR
jgi:hypothetical protein